MLSHITGKTAHEEASSATRTFDVVAAIRARRLKWVGHILRMDSKRLVHKAVFYMHETRPRATQRSGIKTRSNAYTVHSSGDLLMDVPDLEWEELLELAKNRKGWKLRVEAIANGLKANKPAGLGVTVKMSGKGGIVSSNLLRPKTPKNKAKRTETRSARAARRYRERDEHEAFFRVGRGRKGKCGKNNKKKKQPRALTNEERAAAARAYYHAHFPDMMIAATMPSATPTTPKPPSTSTQPDQQIASAPQPSQTPATDSSEPQTPPTTDPAPPSTPTQADQWAAPAPQPSQFSDSDTAELQTPPTPSVATTPEPQTPPKPPTPQMQSPILTSSDTSMWSPTITLSPIPTNGTLLWSPTFTTSPIPRT